MTIFSWTAAGGPLECAKEEAKATVLLDRILGSDRFVVGTCQRG